MKRRVQSRRRLSRESDSYRVGGSFTTKSVKKVETPTLARTVFTDIEPSGLELHRPIIQIAAIAVDAEFNELHQFEVEVRLCDRRLIFLSELLNCPNRNDIAKQSRCID